MNLASPLPAIPPHSIKNCHLEASDITNCAVTRVSVSLLYGQPNKEPKAIKVLVQKNNLKNKNYSHFLSINYMPDIMLKTIHIVAKVL